MPIEKKDPFDEAKPKSLLPKGLMKRISVQFGIDQACCINPIKEWIELYRLWGDSNT